MRDMGETLRDTFGRVFRLENRRQTQRRGRVEEFDAGERHVSVYLPPGYDDRQDRRYPVLYMMDGQNLFDASRAFGGNPWNIHLAADRVVGERTAEPVIIAGVDHAGDGRIEEYTPTRDPAKKAGGGAEAFGRMLLDQIKPAVDARYRTNAAAAIGGSSLGGLVSLYLSLRHPMVFTRAAVMSPSVWWDNRAVLRAVDEFDSSRPRLWVDIGGREGQEAISGARALHDRLQRKGWSDADLHYEEDRRADHSERAWSRRIGRALEFLFPPV